MGQPAKRADEHYTYGDYAKWPEGERWELIEGEAYNMTPAPSRAHQRLLGRLFAQIDRFLEGKRCEAYVAPLDVRLPEKNERDEDVDTVVQPDIMVVCDPGKLDEKGCRGAPDFVIEIVSPATAHKDLGRKKALYEKHGVKEYWTVHPTNIVTVWHLGEDNRYGDGLTVAAMGRVAVRTLPGLEIDLDVVFAPPAEETDASA